MAIPGKTGTVAKNTIIMYIRMFILMCVSFVSSRLLLQALGIEDYGIYSVVGSVSATFVALKSLFSESIQRFLNFYKGKEDIDKQREIFTLSIIIHLVLAIVLAIVLESVGTWLLLNKLVIPAGKVSTALFVFHTTVVASFISVLCIPFDALLIANERIGFYSIVSIFDGLFRLALVLILPHLPFILLKSYSLLLVVIPIVSLIAMLIYCRRLEECKLNRKINKPLLKEVVALSGWNFFGNISFSLLHEGINFILNIYGGLIYNASRSVAYQLKNLAVQFSSNSLIAARPMVMQSVTADDNYKSLFSNTISISRISFFIMLLPITPILVYCKELLGIWLVEVPEYAPLFTRLVLLSVLFRSFHEPLNILHMSIGKIKRMMIIEVVIMISTLLLIYFMLSNGAEMWVSFALLALMEVLIILSLSLNAKLEFGFPFRDFFKTALLPATFLTVIMGAIIALFSLFSPGGIISVIAMCLAVLTVICACIYLFLNEREKRLIRSLVFKH